MRKAIIIFSIGFALIVGGGVITGIEFMSWKPYDMEENVADFPRETIRTEIDFDEFKTEQLMVYNGETIDFDYEDYLEGDFDYIDYDTELSYFISNANDQRVKVEASDKQKEGVALVEYTYLSPFGAKHCNLNSLSYDKNGKSEFRMHTGHNDGNYRSRFDRRSDNRHRNMMFQEDNTTYLFAECYENENNWMIGYNNGSWNGLNITEELKAILRHKQIPVNMSEYKIIVNPKDVDRIVK